MATTPIINLIGDFFIARSGTKTYRAKKDCGEDLQIRRGHKRPRLISGKY